jgi:ribosomal subunit interface protein
MIKINLKVTNFQATPDIQNYLDKKLEKIGDIAERRQDEVILRVEIGKTTKHHKSGAVYRAEIETHVGGKDVRAVSEKEDIFAAIDEAKDELVRELVHNKEKEEALLKKGGRKIKDMLRRFYR